MSCYYKDNKTPSGKLLCTTCSMNCACVNIGCSPGCIGFEMNKHMSIFKYCEVCLKHEVEKYNTQEEKLKFLMTCSRSEHNKQYNEFCAELRGLEKAARRNNDTFLNALKSLPLMTKFGLSI